MVAILKPNRSLRDTFYYNENKLKAGEARCLLAENYPREAANLNELERLGMLQKMAALRPGVKVNCLHISLNFDPSEQLSEERLEAIAREYMNEIGFGNQPYLVYEHFDAAHPHIHLVTTNVQADGQRISLHHLGIHKSEPARKMIELKHGLVTAEEQCKEPYEIKAVSLEKAIYGRTQTKRAIGNVLLGVLDNYKYSSLAELNALLSCYNIKAERGAETSRIYVNRGLVYRILDEKGMVVGVPIKASSYYQKPGLNYLEERFQRNAPLKLSYRSRVKNAVDLALLKQQIQSVEGLSTVLKKQGIDIVLRQNGDGRIYGITYVDHQTKCVFNGSELGKNYSANAIVERLKSPLMEDVLRELKSGIEGNRIRDLRKHGNEKASGTDRMETHYDTNYSSSYSLVELLIQPENTWEPNPYDLTRRRKKRKRKAPGG